jgi:fibrillarin-like pre-rRNA processing protein
MRKIFDGVFLIDNFIVTRNLTPGLRVYGERLIKDNEIEYRAWNPFRSKLAAAIKKGLKNFPFKKGTTVLYLGASTGTTVSHLSDIVESEGCIYAVEVSPHAIKNLIKNCERRENVVPILADANKPQEYEEIGKVDVVYEDVAQPNQDEILVKNSEKFLKQGGIAMLVIKSPSIDVTKKPKETFAEVLDRIKQHFDILERIDLEPFDKEHLFVVLRKL